MTTAGGKRALVTGATGFIGSHLAARLIAEGWDTHIVIRPGSNRRPLEKISGQVVVHEYDGSTESMVKIVEVSKPVVVFHLASLFLAQHQPKDVEPLIKSNIIFGSQLAEAMALHGVTRLVNTGTAWQHYESRPYSPVNLYAATKQAFEAILAYYGETASLRVITLKLFDTYGPDDPRPKLFTLLRNLAQEQKPLAMSPGEQKIDLVYIDDVLNAFVLAAERLLRNEVEQHEQYAVSSGRPVKLQELVNLYSRVIGKALLIEWGGRPYRPREVMTPWDQGGTLPGWKPQIGLEEGIRRMEAGKIH